MIPLRSSAVLGGLCTLIGTSTNLLVAGLVLELGLERIRLFDITPPALKRSHSRGSIGRLAAMPVTG